MSFFWEFTDYLTRLTANIAFLLFLIPHLPILIDKKS